MQFTTPKDNIAKALATVNHAISNRTTLPITLNVHMEAKDNQVHLQGTNLQTHIATSFPAEVQKPGATTIPARLLIDFISSLPPISFNTPPGTYVTHVSCGKAQAHINGASPDDFPPAPEVPPNATISLQPTTFRKAVARTAFCAAKDDARPILSGILMKFSDDIFTMVAADGFRLSVVTLPLENPVDSDVEAVIPSRTLQTLSRLILDNDEPIEIRLSNLKGQALFSIPDTTLTTQLLSGAYPNYTQLLPSSHQSSSTFDIKDLIRATKTASIFANQGSNIIRLRIAGDDTPEEGRIATIAAQAENVGDNVEQVPIRSTTGPEARIAFNANYIQEALAAMDPAPVTLETSSPTSPAVIKPQDPEDKYLQIVMPMFVDW